MKKRLLSMLFILSLLSSILCVEASASYANEQWQVINGVTQERCTYRAWHEAYDRLGISLPTNWGNACTWAANARNQGQFAVDNTPSANSIVCWSGGVGGYGHVAYVTGVDANNVYIREGGVNPQNGAYYRDTSYSRSNQNRWSGYYLEGYIHLGSYPHTHNKGEFVYYWAVHPHYNCYRCSICGEIWHDTSSGNYVSTCSDCGEPYIRDESISYPSALTKGENYSMKGTLVANNGIKWVWLGIYKGDEVVQKAEENVWETGIVNRYSIQPLASKLDFSQLMSGDYRISIQCMDTDNNYFCIPDRAFQVKAKETPNIWAEGINFPSTITKGESASLTGTLKSNNQIKWVWLGIYQGDEVVRKAEDDVWKTGFADSYSINTLAKKLDFSKLSVGNYRVSVQCMDSDNNYFCIPDRAFQVKVKEEQSVEPTTPLEPVTPIEPVTPMGKEVHFPQMTVYFQGQFTDVPADQWFTPYVADAFEFGLMKGDSPTTFKPYGDVTIAEAVTMAARIHSIDTTGTETFRQGEPWYQCYLDYAYQNGIISYAYYNCDVNNKATRAQFAEIFAAAMPSEDLPAINSIAGNAIPDVKATDSYASPVYKLYRAGILTGGDARGNFSPLTYITRAECATIVARMADSDNRVEFSLP